MTKSSPKKLKRSRARHPASCVSTFSTPGKLLKFLKLHRLCSTNLEKLHLESRKTLNSLALLTQFPANPGIREALRLQRGREYKLQSSYQDCRRKLIALIS